MSRVKSRATTEVVCGDCGASDPSWASINRGILLCADCCSVHRSLGRHISQVKSLRQGKWIPSVLNFITSINAHGANSVWEHLLMDPEKFPKNMRRKPSAKDPLHPNKADFIRAKHVNLSFVLKPNVQEVESANIETELSKQLHASVRAPNLETSLRLLVQGADPNYFHEEKGSSPLHMAAKSGQAAQVELLLVFGADIQVPDSQNQTAIDLAKSNNHFVIADRLTEAMYEVTDRLCYFLCNRRPDHAANQHIIIPEQSSLEIPEQLKIARSKLLLIPNKMFEELVMDLYDEVDRRETEAIWSTSALNPEIGAVPFLPANPLLSATRNQGRQKLARFSPSEFAGLLTDVLIDAKRRQNMANLRPLNDNQKHALNLQRCSNLSDDEPLYDAVASDDDYAALAPVAQQAFVNQSPINTRSSTEVDTLKKQLQESHQVINKLQTQIERLASENSQLKSKFNTPDVEEVELRVNGAEPEVNGDSKQQPFGKRPVSMYEPRERPYNRHTAIPDSSRPTASMYHMAKELKESLPLNEEVTRYTEQVTRRIQELVKAMQDLSVPDLFVPCADRIQIAINDLCAIFPTTIGDDSINEPLKQLTDNASEMQINCANLEKCLNANQNSEATLKEVHQCAYNLARANKDLVTRFTA